VEPVPTSFHLGPLVFHTYGFGLAIAAYVAYRYGIRRIKKTGLDPTNYGWFAFWMIVCGLVGARIAHVATNWSLYEHNPLRMLAIWQGGLGSFGGIVLAGIVGFVLARKWWGGDQLLLFADAVIPSLILAWAIGRVLGPQFMVDGGGHVTHQWFGLRYAGQAGKRVPVPLIQGAEDALTWGLLIFIEHKGWARRGLMTGLGCLIWGLVRSLDEKLLLGQESHSGSVGVQIAGLVLALIGIVVLWRSRSKTHSLVGE
jgi:prolipoprotein diacylglyceryltransferase